MISIFKKPTAFLILATMVFLSFFSPAYAQMDYTSITASVDWAAVFIGIAAIATAIAALYVAIKGTRILLNFLRGA